MRWVVFSYSLPSKAQSSPRVALWRRLRRLGAISPTGGIYVLPAREECQEAFQWLAEEVQHAKGEALVTHVDHFEGLTDGDLINPLPTNADGGLCGAPCAADRPGGAPERGAQS